ncbi:MAG: nucleotide exchange factor GrpE [Deltaproteobacteria bacterium]|nr:nucleotide exchange factor GrpE [Deltaproteobacteria bacterium]
MADALASVERAEKDRGSEPSHPEPAAVDPDSSEPSGGQSEAVGDAGEAATPPQAGEEVDQEAVLRDQLLRLAADFENYRKRAQREMQDAHRYGIEKLLGDLLVVVDNLERALAHAGDDSNAVIQGVRMVFKQFVDTLGNYGVKSFASLGKPFDPERHEAVGQAPAGDLSPGSVVEEVAKGYFLHDRLLRPAQVIVAAAPDGDSGAEGSE